MWEEITRHFQLCTLNQVCCIEQNNHIKSSLIIERFIYLSQTKSRCQLSRAGTVSSQLLGALAVSSFQCLSSQCTTVHCTVSTTTYSDPGSALIPITQPASSLQSEGRGRDEEDGGKSLRLYFLQGAPHQLPYDTCIPPNTTQSGGHTQVQGRLRMQSFFFLDRYITNKQLFWENDRMELGQLRASALACHHLKNSSDFLIFSLTTFG